MTYPFNITINGLKIFDNKDVNISFNSGLTVFIGPNGSGKTQVMKALKTLLCQRGITRKVRYLSSNRVGILEQYRSQTMYYDMNNQNTYLGDINYKKARHQIEVATGDFFTLDERKDVYIKVSERLSTLFDRDIFLQWDSGNLRVFFGKHGDSEQYDISAEASGLINLVSILAALYDDEVGVLLIDEPEVSLHPQLQTFLINEIISISGDYEDKHRKMVIMATHSINMINIKDTSVLPNFVFFSDDGKLPMQIEPNAEELSNRKLRDLVGRLGQIHKTAFFAKRPLLVEGISDSLLCNYFDDRFELYLGIAGTQILPVDGKGQFPATVKLMRMIGKTPIVLADLDAFIDDNDVVNLFVNEELAKKKALEFGHADLSVFVRNIKSDFNSMCNKQDNILNNIFTNHSYWKKREDVDDISSKFKKRAILAVLMENSNADIVSWDNGEEWIGIKTRLITLFNSLEEAGCFILRKGTIENYYLFSNQETSSGKPSAALDEIESLREVEDRIVRDNYADILRALEFSSRTKKADEIDAIKRELLCELPSILYVLNKDTTVNDINAIIRRARGTNQSLFEYEPIIENDTLSIDVKLNSKIINVSGFPFRV
ncbi:MAG TPA: hypothetical protein DC000_10455, partial [Clostridiales bacterium]|nr:hypothetical protein [Clostridiales bacterium]